MPGVRSWLRFRTASLLALVAVCAATTWAGLYLLSPAWRLGPSIDPGRPVRERIEALAELAEVPSGRAVGLLASALADPDPSIRENAAAGLFRQGPNAAAAVPAIVRALRDPSRLVRLTACATLGVATPADGPDRRAALAALDAALDDPDADLALAAAESLLRLGEVARAVPKLVLAATGPSTSSRTKGLDALRRHAKGLDVTAELRPLLKSDDPGRRMAALELLVERSPGAARPALREALDDPDRGVRRRAAWELDMLDHPGPRDAFRAVPPPPASS